MRLKILSFTWSAILATAWAAALAAENPTAAGEREQKLISALQSDAPPAEKAIACKQLAVYGTQAAVPALGALLSDEKLASWARIALEVIPGPAADGALRESLNRLQGRLLVGAINSLGVRRDVKAVEALIGRLKDADGEVASAAAVALGHLGGGPATKALQQALPGARAEVCPAVAEGCILCAERLLTEGKRAEAVKLYDTVRHSKAPKQRVVEATRGAILARQSAGIPLLVEQLRSTDKTLLGMALRTARELPGREVTRALAAELGHAAPDRRALLVMALADRGDDAAWPAVLQAAKSAPDKARLAAIRALERWGNDAAVPVLLDAAAGGDVELARAAKATLARLSGPTVDADLSTRLSSATGKTRQALLELAAQRRIEAALPAVVRCADDPDAGVRSAAVTALGALGKAPQAADLVRLLQKSQTLKERQEIEKALVAIGNRSGAGCAPYVLPLAQSGESALRIIALHVLAAVGGPEALAAVKAAVDDKDEAVQDEAVSTLATWPNNWPEDVGVAEPLLALAKSGKKESYRVLGLRGYLVCIQDNKKLKDDEKVSKLNDITSLLARPEEKRLAIAVLGTLPSARGLEWLMTFASDAAVAEEACLAIANLATRNELKAGSRELCQKALQAVIDTSKNDATKKKAEHALKGLK